MGAVVGTGGLLEGGNVSLIIIREHVSVHCLQPILHLYPTKLRGSPAFVDLVVVVGRRLLHVVTIVVDLHNLHLVVAIQQSLPLLQAIVDDRGRRMRLALLGSRLLGWWLVLLPMHMGLRLFRILGLLGLLAGLLGGLLELMLLLIIAPSIRLEPRS